jgi:hypothetical protein
MRVNLLGPVFVEGADGDEVVVGAAKERRQRPACQGSLTPPGALAATEERPSLRCDRFRSGTVGRAK